MAEEALRSREELKTLYGRDRESVAVDIIQKISVSDPVQEVQMALARHHQASGSKPTSLFPKPLSPEPEREAGSDDPEPNSPPDKGEIQRTLQDTTARAISKGSMEPGFDDTVDRRKLGMKEILSGLGEGKKRKEVFVEGKKRKEEWKRKEAEIPWLSLHYLMCSSRPRGICLLINNVPDLAVEEKKLENLFKFLSFEVLIKRGLQRDKLYTLAVEFAKKDHSHFDTFVVIFMSVSCRSTDISCADGRNANLEHVLEEFTASRCPSLRGKPKIFFVQRFKGTRVNGCSISASGSYAIRDSFQFIFTSERKICPQEADFFLISVTSTYSADQPNREPGSLFIQILDEVIRSSHKLYHLLDMLTMVNKQMMDRQYDLPNIRVPHRNQTLRARVYLGSTPLSAPVTSDGDQRVSYEMNKNPRGLCLIVNNVNFRNKDLNRPGAVEDERSLKHLFRTLFFKVCILRDLTSHELESVAQKFGKKNHEAYNAFVFIVMSHEGDHNCIFGVDGRSTTVKSLMSEFSVNNCPSLSHKPKAFIIQAGRAFPEDANHSMFSSVFATTSQAQISSQQCGAALSTNSTLPWSVFPPEADFVLAFATTLGYAAYQDPNNGSSFIQALVEVISKYHRQHHFLEILTEVTRMVVERPKAFQVPAPMDTLTRFLFL